jgi:hypothetical protein
MLHYAFHSRLCSENARLCLYYARILCLFKAFPSRFGSILRLIVRNHIIVLSEKKLANLIDDLM